MTLITADETTDIVFVIRLEMSMAADETASADFMADLEILAAAEADDRNVLLADLIKEEDTDEETECIFDAAFDADKEIVETDAAIFATSLIDVGDAEEEAAAISAVLELWNAAEQAAMADEATLKNANG